MRARHKSAWVPTVTGRRRAAAVLAALLLGSALATTPRHARAAEFPVCLDDYAQSAVDAASAGSVLLVVWEDQRDLGTTGVDVYGALVTAAGLVVPPGEFAITSVAGNQTCPRVASDGTDFLVVWQDDQAGALQLDVHAANVAGDGTVGSPFVVSDALDRQRYPDVAWTGSYYVVAWEDERDHATTGWDLVAARVVAGGGVVLADAAGIKVTFAGDQGSVAVAGGGGDALLVCRHGAGNDILGAVVDSAGLVAVAPFAVSAAASTQKSPRAAFGNGIFLAAWEDYRLSSTGPDIYVARIDPAGSALDNVNVTNDTASRSAAPAVAFDGEDFVVTWEEGPDGASDVFMSRVAADAASLTVREPGGVPACTGAADMDAPSVARAGLGVLVAWADYRNASSDVYAVRISTDDPPAAGTISVSPATPGEGDTVTLGAPAAADPEGLALTYEWEQTEGPAVALSDPAAPAPTFDAPEALAGYTLAFELRLSDGATWSDPAGVTFPVSADDDPPVADAGSPFAVQSLTQAFLDGGASFDPEGAPLAYSWTELSAYDVALQGADGAVAGFVAPDADVDVEFELTVSDGTSAASATVLVQVRALEAAPPEASNVRAELVTADSANVRWETDLAAFGSVRYGTTPALGTASPAEPVAATTHLVALSGLRSGATYYYVVRSEGANGAWTLSGTSTFTTDPPSPSDDSDGDGMPNAWEVVNGLDPAVPADAAADPDGDWLSNLDEYRHGTDPDRRDTDGDGASDYHEVLMGYDPVRSDSVPPPAVPSGSPACSAPGTGGGGSSGACTFVLLAIFAAAAVRRGRCAARGAYVHHGGTEARRTATGATARHR